MIKKQIIVGLIFSLSTFFSFSQTTQPSSMACAKITENVKRLKCFDSLVSQNKKLLINQQNSEKKQANKNLNSATTKLSSATAAVALVTKTKMNQAQLVASFGQAHLASKDERAFEVVEFVVKSAKLKLSQKWQLTFNNNQTWQTKEFNQFVKFKTGDIVIIKRGVMNAFHLKKKGSKRTIRVQRIK